ncbi:MAG: kdtA [Nitrospirae bacterium]|nr:kdtA [Nitrospirota bacterium]
MYILYNFILVLATIVLSPYILFKLATVPKYRGGISQKLGRVRKGVLKVLGGTRPIWVHAVSVGEVMAAHPLIRELKKKYPGRKLILSTVTVTGNFTAKQRVPEADAVFYFPFDYPWIVRRVIQKINPVIVLVAETELWPNFFRELQRQGIPSALINGRISPRSYGNYLRFKRFFTEVFKSVTLFCMQSDEDAAPSWSPGTSSSTRRSPRYSSVLSPLRLGDASSRRGARTGEKRPSCSRYSPGSERNIPISS